MDIRKKGTKLGLEGLMSKLCKEGVFLIYVKFVVVVSLCRSYFVTEEGVGVENGQYDYVSVTFLLFDVERVVIRVTSSVSC